MDQWIKEPMNQWISLSQPLIQWIRESVKQRINESMHRSMNKRMAPCSGTRQRTLQWHQHSRSSSTTLQRHPAAAPCTAPMLQNQTCNSSFTWSKNPNSFAINYLGKNPKEFSKMLTTKQISTPYFKQEGRQLKFFSSLPLTWALPRLGANLPAGCGKWLHRGFT